MDYWRRVLQEVLEVQETDYPFRFTNLGGKEEGKTPEYYGGRSEYRKKDTRVYALGDKYPNCFFTQREAECLVLLLEGLTIVQAAKIMRLSPRTVEFYAKKMRLKTKIATKNELLKIIVKTDVLKNIDFTAADLPLSLGKDE